MALDSQPTMIVCRPLVIVLFCLAGLTGCVSFDRLHFPTEPTHTDGDTRWYDTNRNGRDDFAVMHGSGEFADRLDVLAYDDDEDGTPDRLFRLSDYDPNEVPHLIVLLDSIPFESMREACNTSDRFSFLGQPVKVIAPYPSMSALCFTAILHAPPMTGPINKHYDPRPQTNGVNNLLSKRLAGYRNPWQQRLNYNIRYDENGHAFINPRPWMKAEFEKSRQAFNANPENTTVIYISSTAAMLMKHGRQGLDESLDELERFLLQVLYERRGAVKITVMADHGHNFMASTWIDIAAALKASGFHPVEHLKQPDDVYLEMDGLMTWFGVHTPRPAAVSDGLFEQLPELVTAAYMDGYDVVIRNHDGQARIVSASGGRLSYYPESANVLGYEPSWCGVPMDRDEWFKLTADAEYPDAPVRLWDAFHGQTVNAPQVMCTLRDGYCAGIKWFNVVLKVKSTHGGLNQTNSATFVMSMNRPAVQGPLRSKEVLPAVEPGFVPKVVSP